MQTSATASPAELNVVTSETKTDLVYLYWNLSLIWNTFIISLKKQYTRIRLM